MDLTQLEAFVSLLATGVPIVLTILSAIFGVRTAQRADPSRPALTLTGFERPPEPAAQRRRLRYQRLETVFGLLIMPLGIVYSALMLAALPAPQTRTGRIAYLLAATVYLAVIIFYAVLLLAYGRTARTVLRAAPHRAGGRAQANVTLDAGLMTVVHHCQLAQRQLRTTLQRVDIDAGIVVARRHYFYNLYPLYFDEITIHIEQIGADVCRLQLQSSGVMPSVRSDGARNRHNLEQLLEYLTV